MPQKQKLSLEEKVEIIRAYLEGTISKSEAARRGGVTRDTIEQWARNYESDGAEAFLLHKNRVYSSELKRQAVEDYLSGSESQSDICKNIIFEKEHSFKSGFRCIISMEISTPQGFLEEEVT